MGGANPNPFTLAALGTSATQSVAGHGPGWILEHRHPDGEHWQIVGYYGSKALAKETAKAFVAAGYGASGDFRVERWKGPSNV